MQQGTAVTHQLESQEQESSAGLNYIKAHSHTQTGEPKTGMMSKVKMQ